MNNTAHPRFLAVAAAALALGSIAACGSNDDTTTKAAPTVLPTVHKADFVVQGNALCKKTSETIGSKFATMSKPPKPAELSAAFATVLKESYKLDGELLSIGAPAGQQKEFVDLIRQLHQVTANVETEGQEAFFADESDPWKPAADKLVKDFGLTQCGNDE